MEKTLLEQWIDKGIELGVEKGIELGSRQGEINGKRNLLRVYVEGRFSEFVPEFDRYVEQIREPDDLDRITRVIFCAQAVPELRRTLNG